MDAVKAMVLGCGPTGLLAAHGMTVAAAEAGVRLDLAVFSSKRKSELYGCQYLHAPIPWLELEMERVSYRLIGSISGYREKVYGNEAAEDVAVSPELLESDHDAWDIRAAYDQLWNRYRHLIVDYFLSRGSWLALRANRPEDVVVTTVPAPVLCEDVGCTFYSQPVWAMGDAHDLGRKAAWPGGIVPERTIVCSGLPEHDWYRASHVFGHGTVEWPLEAAPPRGASRVSKPLRNTCECNPSIIRSGRYGRWEKGVLAHTSFEDGYNAIMKAVQ